MIVQRWDRNSIKRIQRSVKKSEQKSESFVTNRRPYKPFCEVIYAKIATTIDAANGIYTGEEVLKELSGYTYRSDCSQRIWDVYLPLYCINAGREVPAGTIVQVFKTANTVQEPIWAFFDIQNSFKTHFAPSVLLDESLNTITIYGGNIYMPGINGVSFNTIDIADRTFNLNVSNLMWIYLEATVIKDTGAWSPSTQIEYSITEPVFNENDLYITFYKVLGKIENGIYEVYSTGDFYPPWSVYLAIDFDGDVVQFLGHTDDAALKWYSATVCPPP